MNLLANLLPKKMSKKSNLIHGFKKKAENKSLELRKLNQKKEFERLPAKDLAQYLDVIIISPEDIPGMTNALLKKLRSVNSSWSAVTLDINGNTVVILNPSHSVNRIESNIFHELSHLICEHEMKGFETLNGMIFRVYDVQQEKEAEWLGGCLHIPRKALEWAFRNNMSRDSISKYYLASSEMVEFRINSTGVKYQYRYSKSK